MQIAAFKLIHLTVYLMYDKFDVFYNESPKHNTDETITIPTWVHTLANIQCTNRQYNEWIKANFDSINQGLIFQSTDTSQNIITFIWFLVLTAGTINSTNHILKWSLKKIRNKSTLCDNQGLFKHENSMARNSTKSDSRPKPWLRKWQLYICNIQLLQRTLMQQHNKL